MNVNNNQKEKVSHSIARKKEKAVIAITLLCFAISGIVLPQIRPAAASTDIETAIVQQHNDSKKEKSKHTKNTAEKEKRKEKTEEEKKEESEDETQDEAANAEHKEESDKKKKEQAATQDPAGNTPASNSSSSNAAASSSGSSASTPAAAPAKEKVWVPPVYQTIHHEAVYNTVKVVVCNYCGAEFGSTGEFQAHKDANGG